MGRDVPGGYRNTINNNVVLILMIDAAPPLKMRGSRRATNGNEPKRSLRKSAGC
jgi:hypothetical protein